MKSLQPVQCTSGLFLRALFFSLALINAVPAAKAAYTDDLPTSTSVIDADTTNYLTKISTAPAGAWVRLANGTYPSAVTVTNNQIVVMAKNPRGAVISNKITVSGDDVILYGLKFVGTNARVALDGIEDKVLRCLFTGWEEIAIQLTQNGIGAEIAYNELHNPADFIRCVGGVEPPSNQHRYGIRPALNQGEPHHDYVHIHRNYFHDFPRKPNKCDGSYNYGGGQSDAIEIGEGGDTAQFQLNWLVEFNLVENHEGNDAVIDIKSSNNTVRYNTLLDCYYTYGSPINQTKRGRIDSRVGDNNVVLANYLDNSGGINVRYNDNDIVGNVIINSSESINVLAGDQPATNYGNGSVAPAVNTIVRGNTAPVEIGGTESRPYGGYPAKDTCYTGNTPSSPTLISGQQTGTTTCTGSYPLPFGAAFKLTTSDVGLSYPAQVLTPGFSLAAGTYVGTQSVTISTGTTGATIRYTTNGTTPTSTTGTVYSAPVSIASNATLKAIAYKTGMTDSAVRSDSYTILSPTQCPYGYTIALYNIGRSKYVRVDTSGGNKLKADSATATTATRFTVINNGDGSFSLQYAGNSLYAFPDNTSKELSATGASVGIEDKYTWGANGDGTISFTSNKFTGLYVFPRAANGDILEATGASIGPEDKYTWILMP